MAKSFQIDQQWLDRIAEQAGGIQYGQVTITIHDGRIVQIDRTERTRYDQVSRKHSSNNQQQEPEAHPEADAQALRSVQ